jgi:predicted O-methyltransferase YrrM
MNIERALATPGWVSAEELTYLAERASRSRVICEIGSWEGRSTIAMAENTKGVVYAVDSWTGSMDNANELSVEVLHYFLRNTRGLMNILPVPLPSLRAHAVLKNLGLCFNMVFIDASHEYADVAQDIVLWKELLAPDAILCGHDYDDAHLGLKQAVDQHIPRFRIVPNTTIWTTEEA